MNDKYLAPPVPVQNRRKKLHKSTVEIARMYGEGLTISEIAKARGTSTISIKKTLTKQGLYVPIKYPLTEDEKARIVWKIITQEDTLEGLSVEYNRSPITISSIVRNAGYRKINGQYIKVKNPITKELDNQATSKKDKRKTQTNKSVEVEQMNEEIKTMTFQEELNALVLDELMKIKEGREAIERKGMFRIVREIEAAVAKLLN